MYSSNTENLIAAGVISMMILLCRRKVTEKIPYTQKKSRNLIFFCFLTAFGGEAERAEGQKGGKEDRWNVECGLWSVRPES